MQNTYTYLMLFASGVAMTISILVTAVKIPYEPGLEKFRTARKIFAIASALLAVLIFSCVIVGYVHPFDSLAVLATASYQALLLINMIIVFIDPDTITEKAIVRDFMLITAVMSAPYLTLWLCPGIYSYVYWSAVLFYVLQIAVYSKHFIKSFKNVIRLTDEYYAENNAQRLAWVHRIFIAALTVGLWAVVCLFVKNWSYLVLIPVLLATYVITAASIINYASKSSYIVSALNANAASREETSENETDSDGCAPHVQRMEIPESVMDDIRRRLDIWVAEKGFMARDVPYEETLARIGIDVVTMRRYMKDELGTDFRTWRNGLKLEEARRLFEENPEMNVGQVSDKVGYNDSSNFHKDFKKRFGMSPGAYRKTVAG